MSGEIKVDRGFKWLASRQVDRFLSAIDSRGNVRGHLAALVSMACSVMLDENEALAFRAQIESTYEDELDRTGNESAARYRQFEDVLRAFILHEILSKHELDAVAIDNLEAGLSTPGGVALA